MQKIIRDVKNTKTIADKQKMLLELTHVFPNLRAITVISKVGRKHDYQTVMGVIEAAEHDETISF